jgi:hypothetical protein
LPNHKFLRYFDINSLLIESEAVSLHPNF